MKRGTYVLVVQGPYKGERGWVNVVNATMCRVSGAAFAATIPTRYLLAVEEF